MDSVYSDARNEYLKQLSTWIIPSIVDFFRTEYSTIVSRDGNKRAMAIFQEFCTSVPKWNQDIIETNISLILDNCHCDYVEELMTAVFIAHTKMLTSIRVNSKQKKLQITLPKLDHFIHRIFVECARSFWKAPFLFSEELMPIERQKNILQLENIATEALSSAIRSLLPVKSILRDYMNDNESESESSSEEEVVSKKSKKSSKTKVDDHESSDDDAILEEIKRDTELQEAPDTIPIPIPIPISIPISVPVSSETETIAPKAKEFEKHTPFTIQKVDNPPDVVNPIGSLHSVDTELKSSTVLLQKDPQKDPESPANPNPPQLLIDTEPSVHFTPYDTVFDENQSEISTIRYTPKVSVEDKPPSNWGMSDEDDVPKISISNTASSLSSDEIVDLDPPTVPAAVSAAVAAGTAVAAATEAVGIFESVEANDIDEPLTSSGDFEELN